MLLTRFLGEDGVAEISDFMPIQHLGHCHDLVRRVKVVRGETDRCGWFARPGLIMAAQHTVHRKANEVTFHSRQERPARRCGCAAQFPCAMKNGEAVAEFKLRAGEARHSSWKRPDGRIAVGKSRLRVGILQGDDELLARVGRPLAISRALARNGQPLRADAQAADLAAVRFHRGRAHIRPAGRKSAARATGIIATPGSATPPSRSTR